jgi:predicted nuclease of predicted toxin-antitoxin system
LTRILLDQGVPRSAAKSLVAAGWDAAHVFDLGLARATDREIIEYASNDDRIVCTLDADFHALLAVADASGPTIIRVRQEGLSGADFSSLLLKIWPRIEDACQQGALVSVSERTVRIRRLPLSSAGQQSEP